MFEFRSWASRINSLPLLEKLSPTATRAHSAEECAGFLATQKLAQRCASEVASFLQVGWTELQTANLMETWLRDHGVKTFFHKPFVWWGDRSKFVGVRHYWDYLPSKRALRENEPFILDVAPSLDGYVADIGFSGCKGTNAEFDQAVLFLGQLREALPSLVTKCRDGRALWKTIDELLRDAGYENIHATYPFGVLAHRLHRNSSPAEANFIHFGWQSYWELLSRGLFGQLWNKDFAGNLDGLWAIEPHLGTNNLGVRDFGAKFEEILVVENGVARWLDAKPCFHPEENA